MNKRKTEAEKEYSKTRTGERFWFTIAGYLSIVFATLAYISVSYMISSGSNSGTGHGLLILGLVFFSILPYPAFFLDTNYVRGKYIEWTPSWRRYFGIGILVPIGMFIISMFSIDIVPSVGISLLSFLLITILLSVYHLYKRQKYTEIL
jgi:hypothetical protein